MLDPKLKEQLHDEYKNVFERIEDICIVEQLSEAELDERMEYLLDVFLCAQKDGVVVDKIVGTDLRAFCTEFFDVSENKLTARYIRTMLKQTVTILLWMLGFFEVLQFFLKWAEYGSLMQAATESVSAVLVWVIASVVCIFVHGLATRHILRYMILRYKKYKRAYRHVLTGVNIVLYMLLIGFSEHLVLPVFVLPRWVGLLVFAGLAIWKLVEHLMRYLRRPKLAKGERRIRSSYCALRTHVASGIKRFERQNDMRIAKGKPPISVSSFMEKFHKQAKNAEKISVLILAPFNLFLMGEEIFDCSVPSDFVWAWVLFGVVCAFDYFSMRRSCRLYKDLSYLCKTYNRTFFDDDIAEILRRHTDH